MSRWKKKRSRTIAESTFFTLKEDDVMMKNGEEKVYTMLDIPDFAGVLPVYKDKFVLIRNYRYPIDKMVLEIPAGLIEGGEEPMETARRELEEETGFLMGDAEKLCEYHPIASLNIQTAHLFLGGVKRGGTMNHDHGEDMEVELIPISEVYGMLDDKKIDHPHTMIALFYARARLEKFLK
ncbi:MAG: NUDIX hydrolase [Thermoplasmata archaeon]